MNNIQVLIKEMEDDISKAKKDRNDFYNVSDYNRSFAAGIVWALEKHVKLLTLLLNAETQATVKKPEA